MNKKLCLLLCCVVPVNTVLADVIASGDDCGDDCHWAIHDDGTLDISGTGGINGYGYFKTDSALYEGGSSHWQSTAPWGQYSAQIKDINIHEGITSIGRVAFYNLAATSVHLPDTLETMAYGAFQYSALKEVEIPSSVKYIGAAAFYSTSIKTAVLPENVEFGDIFVADTKSWIFTAATKIYCSQNDEEKCKTIVSNPDIIQTYTKSSNGQYLVGGKWYNNLDALTSGNRTKKLIYTVEEAEMLSKPTGNKFKIRYK
ncbi:MAG: leucine-rich repeat domain-containing protein [Alphaproteobacteria bacterium]|nr:leucine-rich repeat domain-containing protein [Alphaproteobacteria bacterium]